MDGKDGQQDCQVKSENGLMIVNDHEILYSLAFFFCLFNCFLSTLKLKSLTKVKKKTVDHT